MRRLQKDARGATAIETAIIMPIFLMMALGTFDIGYLMYNRATLTGMVEKAARDSTIESNIGDASADIDAQVRDMLLLGASQATVDFTRTSFEDFTSAATMEPYIDANGNKTCDNGEAYEDQNSNGSWDNGGRAGQGGAKDVVIYQVDLSYPRLVPFAAWLGWSDDVKLTAKTVVSNQPYAAQQQRSSKMGFC